MENSKISWTDHTFNPWIGCTKVSPGCLNCYAETQDVRRFSKTLPGCSKDAPVSHWGKGAPRYRTSAAMWEQPVKWNKEAAEHQTDLDARPKISDARNEQPEIWIAKRPRVFCASLSDWLDDEVPIEWLADLLDLIRRTPHLDWLLLTKRPQNWEARLSEIIRLWRMAQSEAVVLETAAWVDSWLRGQKPANVWIGTTTEDQTRADERIPALFRIPARVRFLSCEPLLGPVVLPIGQVMQGFPKHITAAGHAVGAPLGIHWVIVGGESGTRARPMHPEWASSLRDQCAVAGVAFHFKQWGEWMPATSYEKSVIVTGGNPGGLKDPEWFTFPDGQLMARIGKRFTGRLLDGIEHNAFPVVEVAK
jgi:protein gp37